MTLRPGVAYAIADLLPHGPYMMLLDRLVSYDDASVTCEVTIRPDSRFCTADGVPGWVGIEYMAQALCAYIGIVRLQAGRKVQVELLLGTRSFDCTQPYFAVGSRLQVSAELLFHNPDGVCAFACAIRQDGRLLAESEIKGYGPDDIEPYLNGLSEAAA